MSGDPDVIVVGGGFAGLSAATLLAERGRHVLVIEARPSTGGRATAFTDPSTGERVDNGQHVLVGGYHETFRFLRRIGTASDVYLQPHLTIDFVDDGGRRSRLFCPGLPPPLHLLAGVTTWKALSWRDRICVLRLGGGLRRADALHKGHSQTVREWLERQGQTPRTIEMLWAPLAVAALNESIERAAAAPFVEVLRRMFGRGPRDASLGLPRKPLDELYAIPAQQYIEARGGTVRTGETARIVCDAAEAMSPRRGTGFTIELRRESIRAPTVICAVPWYALGDTFVDPPEALRPVIADAQATSASPIVTVNLWFNRRVTDAPFVGLPGRAMQWVFDKGTLFGGETSHLSLVSSGADALVARTNDELIEIAMAEIAAALPRARGGSLRRAVVVRERRATFSVAPGQPPRPGVLTGMPGLFLAGDWIDTGLPATIESAVVSGHRAADAAMADSDF